MRKSRIARSSHLMIMKNGITDARSRLLQSQTVPSVMVSAQANYCLRILHTPRIEKRKKNK